MEDSGEQGGKISMASSLKAIAAKYKMSVGTLSKVINNQEGISQRTRERVLEILEKEHYIPNNIARSLRKNSTGIIGVIIPDIKQQFFNMITRGIERDISKEGYLILLSDTEESPDKEKQYLELMFRQCVDALVVATVDAKHIDLQKIYNMGIPVVFIDTIPETDLSLDAVLVDDYLIGEKIAKYLLRLGHKKIAAITGNGEDSTPSVKRLEGLVDTCRKSGCPIPGELMCRVGYEETCGYEAMRKLLSDRKNRPFTAVAVMHELISVGAIRAIREHGLKIGEDISLIGCDLNERIQLSTPQITNVKQPEQEIGQMVASLLLQRLKQKQMGGTGEMLQDIGRKVLLSPIMDIRESCKKIG